jgi:hypothetical protein
MTTDIDIADLAMIEVGKATDVKNYFTQLWAALTNQAVVHDFRTLTIPKATARKIYQRAYPKAKV